MFAFEVETGTGVANATSYASVENFLAYWQTARNVTRDAFTDAARIRAALVIATDYIERRFRHRFPGERLTETQGLWFPVEGFYDDDGNEVVGVPKQIVAATCEYALRSIDAEDGNLAPDPIVADTGQDLKAQDTDGLVTTFQDGAVARLIRPYPMADMLIREVLGRGPGLRTSR